MIRQLASKSHVGIASICLRDPIKKVIRLEPRGKQANIWKFSQDGIKKTFAFDDTAQLDAFVHRVNRVMQSVDREPWQCRIDQNKVEFSIKPNANLKKHLDFAHEIENQARIIRFKLL